MKTTYFFTALAVVGLSLALASPAKAADSKMYAGSGCKVFGDTAWTDLQFGATGIRNKSTTPKNIICPIPKDYDSSWDGTSTAGAYVHFHLLTGNNTKTTTCNVYSVSSGGNVDYTLSDTVGGFANSEDWGDIYYLQSTSGDHSHATMLCTLAAGSRLVYYYVDEYGDTN